MMTFEKMTQKKIFIINWLDSYTKLVLNRRLLRWYIFLQKDCRSFLPKP